MTVKLIKRSEQINVNNKPQQQSPSTQVLLTTQSWVDEFKERKSKNGIGLLGFARHN